MNNPEKFKVIRLYDATKLGGQALEDFLNERYRLGEEFVGVFEDKFIFKKIYYSNINQVENYLEE
jgi:hypothetical protein